ncbi:hypothetical protein N7540_009309 [Penicillium herquei]|nr:hypothetical protein N7540_009309 [Penicillium herquei]
MRLCSFLSAAQQFTGVVETFVSSNPTIAALIWGGLKTAILVASNVSSYFEKVTRMIMGVGRSCPTFQQFGQLYPGCVGLQGALCDYYAVIINLCVKLIQVSHRSSTTQTLLSIINPFESEFQPILDDLNKEVEQVKQHISLASKQANQEDHMLSEFERQKNSSFRKSAVKFFKDSEREQAEADEWRMHQIKREIGSLKTSIRHNLSQVKHVEPWRRAPNRRMGGTAEWLQADPAFIQWKESSGAAILWCSGTMGVGKTVLMSNVVLQLHDQRQSDIISYFFCTADDKESLLARNIFGSVVSQLLHNRIDESLYSDLVSLAESTEDLNIDEIIQLLMSQIQPDKTYFMIFDGLDECDSSQIRESARGLGKLCQQSPLSLKILCAGRPGLEEELFAIIKPAHKISIEKFMVNPDIKRFLELALNKHLEEGRLILRDDSLKKKILDALQAGADGMFLWASLCLGEICEQNCDENVLKALEHFPEGLRRFLTKILNVFTKVMQYCGVVKRPLTTEEYKEALSILPQQTTLDTKRQPHSMDLVIRACYGLTFIDEEELTVHYVHHSLRTHLFTTAHTRSVQYNFNQVDVHFGHMCMTYLDFTNFKGQLVRFQRGSAAPIDPFQLGTSSVLDPKGSMHHVAERLIEKRKKTTNMTFGGMKRLMFQGLKRYDIPEHAFDLQLQRFAFLNYARNHWSLHLTKLDLVEIYGSQVWKLFHHCIESDDTPSVRLWGLTTEDLANQNCEFKLVRWISRNSHAPLLRHYLRERHHFSLKAICLLFERIEKHDFYRFTDAIFSQIGEFANPDYSTQVLEKVLYYADEADCERSVNLSFELLTVNLKTIHLNSHFRTSLLNYALLVAVKNNRLDMMDILLSSCTDYYTPLHIATDHGLFQVVEKLLSNGADVNRFSVVDLNFSPRQHGYKFKIIDTIRLPPLHIATLNNNYMIVDALLAAGSDVDADSTISARVRDMEDDPYGSSGPRAIHIAGGNHDCDMVARLLAAGADVNGILERPCQDEKTALHFLVRKDSLSRLATVRREQIRVPSRLDGLRTLRLLIQSGANIHLPSVKGLTALHMATEGERLDLMNALLYAGAKANPVSTLDNIPTPLDVAAENECLPAMKLLLARGGLLRVNQTKKAIVALESARKYIYSARDHLLLAAGANDWTFQNFSNSELGHYLEDDIGISQPQ